jgi:glycyl-tRNA synthetase beta chain
MREGLASVTYQAKIGSYADKCERVALLAEAIAVQVGADAAQAKRAAQLSKADLQSRMVGEFPELQGIMGRYYAGAMGEPGAVADAIDHAYMPRFAGDAIAPSKLSQVLAVAERLDNLASGFGAGLKPSGNKDPFALRPQCAGPGAHADRRRARRAAAAPARLRLRPGRDRHGRRCRWKTCSTPPPSSATRAWR